MRLQKLSSFPRIPPLRRYQRSLGAAQDESEFQCVERDRARSTIGHEPGLVTIPGSNQRRANSEHSVRIEIAVAVAEHVCDESLIARRIDHEVHVRRPPWMAR